MAVGRREGAARKGTVRAAMGHLEDGRPLSAPSHFNRGYMRTALFDTGLSFRNEIFLFFIVH